MPERPRFRWSVVVSIAALGLYGLVRLTFNAVTVRVFGPEALGVASVGLSWQTLFGVLVGAVPAMFASKFVSEARGAGAVEEGRRLLGGVFVVSGLAASLLAAGSLLFSSGEGQKVLWPYGSLFVAYLVLRAAYLALDRKREYLRAELVGSTLFFVVFGAACALGDYALAVRSLLAHPTAFLMLGMFDLRREWVASGAIDGLRTAPREHASFAGATLINAIAGLGGYHFAIVVAGWILPTPTLVGYVSAMMAALSPMNLLPQALGTVLFPEIARRYGSGDALGRRALVSASTTWLSRIAVVPLGLAVIFPEIVCVIAGVPILSDTRTTASLLGGSLLVAMVSSPSGHLLNATRYAMPHALASLGCLLIGSGIGAVSMSQLGLMGAGVMRVSSDATAGVMRMWLAQRTSGWMGNARAVYVISVLVSAAFMAVGSLSSDRAGRLGFYAAGVLAMLSVSLVSGRVAESLDTSAR